MKWNHLPVAGGLYDQDPDLLRKFEIIFSAADKHEKAEDDKRKSEQKRQSFQRARPAPSSRRRR